MVSFFGDGAVAQGAFHEAANLAALWRLPMVFFCENNGYAEFSPIADQHPVPMAARAAGYGLEYVPVDGNDVEAVAAVMTDAVGRIRAGGGPVFVEAATYRWHGHYEGDPEKYRGKDELTEWQQRDPLVITRARLLGRGVGAGKARPDRGPGAGQDRRRRRRRQAGAAAGHERAPLLGVRTASGRRRAGLDAGP